jgi:dTDP-4-dehydrorhamnose reductase
MLVYLIWGGNGWIGNMLCELLKSQTGNLVYIAKARLENLEDIQQEIEDIRPNFVINAAGLVGTPNIDWCETHKYETYNVNTIGTNNLAFACYQKNIHLTYYATGCIYNYDEKNPVGTFFSEKDLPNYWGSTYSHSKLLAENLLKNYNNVLTLRIRLPVTADGSAKCLLTKLNSYSKLINIANSLTVLPDLLPTSIKMMQRKLTGIYNFTNQGTLTHNQIMQLYREYVDPTKVWQNFTLEEQALILKAPRCNCALDVSKLHELYPVKSAYDALKELLQHKQLTQ